jgi:hypothetical protein
MNNEILGKINDGVRNIEISRMFHKDISYNMHTGLEDENGTLMPEFDHCWLTWQSRFTDYDGKRVWINEAMSFPSIEKAKEAQLYLQKHIISQADEE